MVGGLIDYTVSYLGQVIVIVINRPRSLTTVCWFNWYRKTEEMKDGRRTATSSVNPTSVNWQYLENLKDTFLVDPELTVTGLMGKPDCDCEVTINLSETGVEGMYRADGSYYGGRPVLYHSKGHFSIIVHGGCWVVILHEGSVLCLKSMSASSQCPADPRSVRNERLGLTHWEYRNKKGGWSESRRISVKCKKHKH